MSFLGKFEEACAAFIERAFAATFPSRIEPAQIARKLVATMEAHTVVETGGRIAPNAYEVRVHPEDFRRLTTFIDYLQTQWEALLADMAEKVGVGLPYPPRVTLRPDPALVLGAVDIAAAVAGDAARAAAAPATLMLRVRRGVSPATSYALVGTLTIGRGEDNDIVLADARVSRRHARITAHGGSVAIEDTNSSNGTFVNGSAVRSAQLVPGSLVVVGETEMIVEGG